MSDIKTYGSFRDFEIRDLFNISGENIPNSFDLVVWGKKHTHCFTIAIIKWNENENWFDVDMCGTRYLEYGTEELSKWLLAWCNLKAIEITSTNNNKE